MTDDFTLVIPLSGELDLADRDHLTELILQAIGTTAQDIVLDLAGTTFMDSEALGALLAGFNAGQRAGKTVRVINATGSVLRVLEISGVFGHSRRVT